VAGGGVGNLSPDHDSITKTDLETSYGCARNYDVEAKSSSDGVDDAGSVGNAGFGEPVEQLVGVR
jgi:hypothetical protein